ncbi:MAG TPA: site-specific DNA-methyltransferase [Methanoregulaceae archaeon]|nr:site-specific DNA-methyltransferase [Methanoregulaceae archaeon]HOV67415.1 site-specific DNA-methyltransferase [Methanoregulaceae archaeon]HQJ88067.1 site-specific DNA-methyltransferase [Methanoregulaceae archaeon]
MIEPVRCKTSLFVNCDCIEGARRFLPDGSVDLVVTDPPYGIGGDRLDRHYNRDERHVVDGYVEVPADKYGAFSAAWVAEAARVLRPGGALFVVSGYTHLYEVLGALRSSPLVEVNHVIWKYPFGVFTQRKFVSSHYHVLYWARPGGPRTFNLECRYGLDERDESGGSLNYRDREDVWTIGREYKPGKAKNRNELPQALLEKIILYASNEGDLVCDLFLGGGSSARAAIGLGRRFVGFELSPAIFAARLPELRRLEPGSRLSSLRRPAAAPRARRGRAWTEEEDRALAAAYARLRAGGLGKGAAIERLAAEFGRGRFGIEKRLARRG